MKRYEEVQQLADVTQTNGQQSVQFSDLKASLDIVGMGQQLPDITPGQYQK